MMINIKKTGIAILLSVISILNFSDAAEVNDINLVMNSITFPNIYERDKPILDLKFTDKELVALEGETSHFYQTITQAALIRVGQENYFDILEVFCRKADDLKSGNKKCRCGEYYISDQLYNMAFYQIQYSGVYSGNGNTDLNKFLLRGTWAKYNRAILGATIWIVKKYLDKTGLVA